MTPDELEAIRERDARVPLNPVDAGVVTVLAIDRRVLLAEVDRLRAQVSRVQAAAREDLAVVLAQNDEMSAEVDRLRAQVASLTEAEALARALLLRVGEAYGRLLAIHEHVVMDTPEDRELHAQTIDAGKALLRAALAGTEEES